VQLIFGLARHGVERRCWGSEARWRRCRRRAAVTVRVQLFELAHRSVIGAVLRQQGAVAAVQPPRSGRRACTALRACAPRHDRRCAGAARRGGGSAAAAQQSPRACSSSLGWRAAAWNVAAEAARRGDGGAAAAQRSSGVCSYSGWRAAAVNVAAEAVRRGGGGAAVAQQSPRVCSSSSGWRAAVFE
jgi:hypothetical protein